MSQNFNFPGQQSQMPFATMRGFIRQRREDVERCELCATELGDEHDHLFEPVSRQLVCTCAECLVSTGQQDKLTYLRLSRRIVYLEDFNMPDGLWDSLMIPVGMAFFFYNTPAKRVMAFYPGPAGATESLLSLDAWEELLVENPVLARMQPDVEALLVNRLQSTRDYYLVPIDKCYEMAGLLRVHWRGFSGGLTVWAEIARFYAGLKEKAAPIGEKPGE